MDPDPVRSGSTLFVVVASKTFSADVKNRCLLLRLFDLILYVPVNNFSVKSGRVFRGTKQELMCIAQGHNTVPPVRLKPTTPWSRIKHFTTALPDFCCDWRFKGLGRSIVVKKCDLCWEFQPTRSKCHFPPHAVKTGIAVIAFIFSLGDF